MGPGQGVVVVRCDFHEAGFLIKGASGFHVGKRVQQHGGVARQVALGHDALDQQAPQAEAAEGAPNEQPLHLAGVEVVCVGHGPEGHAASGRAIHQGQQQ